MLGTWTFNAPDGTRIDNFTLQRSSLSRRGTTAKGSWSRGYALFQDATLFDQAHLLEKCFAWDLCNGLGSPYEPLGGASAVSRSGLNASRLIIVADCLATANDGCPADSVVSHIDIYEARIGLLDPSPPVILDDPRGPLFSRGRLSGTQNASFAATDRGGGLYRVALAVDGATYDSQPIQPGLGSCNKPVTTPVPCPLSASDTYSFDTRALPDGTHTLRLAVSDIAGNTTYSRPRVVTIRNHARANGAGATREAKLSAHFGDKGGRYRATGYGARPFITGRLRRPDGQAIRNASIDILSRPARDGSKLRVVGHARSNQLGTFRYRVKKGSSRRLRVAYRAYDLDDTASTHADLKLDVHAGVALTIRPRTVRNGHSITFTGRLRGGPGQGGTLITLQETRPRPLTFLTVHADRHGRFRASYRFRYTTQRSLFAFRALVQRQPGYPYLAGRSRALNVLVTP